MNVTNASAAFIFFLLLQAYIVLFFFEWRRTSIPKRSPPLPSEPPSQGFRSTNFAELARGPPLFRQPKAINSSELSPILPGILQARALPLKLSLQKEFRHFNSTLLDISTCNEQTLRNSTCVIIATSQANYRYSKQWITHHRSARIPFIQFTTGPLARSLMPHYGRIFALIAASKALPNVRTFVYTDIDTAIEFRNACGLNEHPIAISWKPPAKEPFNVILRTNWFVFNPYSNANYVSFAPMRVLETWIKHARDVRLQDQTVLNELYRNYKWVRDSISLVSLGNATPRIEIAHCGSYLNDKQRTACINRIHSAV